MIKKKHSLGLLLSLFVLLGVLYGNCAPTPALKNLGSALTLEPQNYLQSPRPDLICGESGWGYLMNEYVEQYCSACHNANGLVLPYFADTTNTLNGSFHARTISKTNFLESVRDNRFCGPNCDLDPRGEVYQAIEEWYDNPNCP